MDAVGKERHTEDIGRLERKRNRIVYRGAIDRRNDGHSGGGRVTALAGSPCLARPSRGAAALARYAGVDPGGACGRGIRPGIRLGVRPCLPSAATPRPRRRFRIRG